MNFTIPIYQKKDQGDLTWTTLSLGPHTVLQTGHNALKLQLAIVNQLKTVIEQLSPREVERFQMPRGLRLQRVHLELTLRGSKKRKVSGKFPLVLEPRWTSDEHRIVIAYHPFRQQEWFPTSEDWPLEEQAAMFFQKTWADLEDSVLAELGTNEKDVIKSISFTARPKTLLDQLPDHPKGLWEDLIADPTKTGAQSGAPHLQGSLQVLPKIGTNQTLRAIEGVLPSGMPRSPYREQLQLLLCGEKKRPVIVAGAPGSGKSTIIARFIQDLLEADDYESHRNLDKIHEVWLVSGKRIIAGMSYVGDWEQRCIDLLQDAKRKRIVLLVEDIHAFGRIGQTRHSDRNLADFFRGPVARGELTIVGECTPEQLQRLEDDAPSFASLFTRVHVHPTTTGETLRMIMHEARILEQKHRVAFDPFTFRTVLELGGSLFPAAAFPGKALDLLRDLAKEVESDAEKKESAEVIAPKNVITSLAKKTGLPELLLEPSQKLDAAELRRELEKSVMGQKVALEAACDLILRIKAGLTDPQRPYGVYLFTGPTGTGKTELATSIATYLYGDASRLLRFDMSEFGSPDAPSRLIGDRFSPEGLLTQQVQDQAFCVVLLDEIEKAHPSVLNLLLQLFDEGRLTDAKGTTADFRHAVIVMTSNLGAKARSAIGFEETPEAVLLDIARAVREFFPPELFNRIDRVVPFRPLSKEIARRIAEKELSRLVARRGLIDRSIFVYANEAVFDRIVREAFDPKDGARPVKRWVERKIGSLLTEEIVKREQRASMQIFRVFDSAAGFRLHADQLVEAEPKTSSSALEPLLDLGAAELTKQLPAVLALVRKLLESADLANVSERLGAHLDEYNLGKREHDDVIYNLESMRTHLLQFRDQIELALEGDGGHTEDRRSWAPKTSVRPLLKEEILAALAEVHFLRRALRLVHDPGQHAVFIELLRVGRARDPGRFRALEDADSKSLLESLAEAYLDGRGTAEGYALREQDGTLVEGTGHFSEGTEAEGIFSSCDHAVLKIVGLCVLELFGDEQGSHIAQSLRTGTELVRVRVWPAKSGLTPKQIILDHQENRRAFEHALESGRQEIPPNPEALLPAVRALRFEAPERESLAPSVEVEDYVLGYSTRTRAKTMGEILSRIWLLRMSRTGAEGPPDTEAPQTPEARS